MSVVEMIRKINLILFSVKDLHSVDTTKPELWGINDSGVLDDLFDSLMVSATLWSVTKRLVVENVHLKHSRHVQLTT